MSRFDTRNPEPPAIGQVAIIPFEEEFDTFTTLKALDNLTTCLIIKPNAKWSTSYFKFCGGMLVAGEQLDFRVAAQRELRQETGITCPIGRFHKILRTQKLQFRPILVNSTSYSMFHLDVISRKGSIHFIKRRAMKVKNQPSFALVTSWSHRNHGRFQPSHKMKQRCLACT